MSRPITGWKIDEADRAGLLRLFPPRYARTVADHVTLRSGTDAGTPLPTARSGEIVGEADDGAGVQALLVRIDGTTERGDGGHFHITWSLDSGREARESNGVIKDHGWTPVAPPLPVRLHPARWDD